MQTFKDIFFNKLNNVPVCVNNYYGDPTLQWGNTINKLKSLKSHQGIVSIITRGLITDTMAKELYSIGLKKFVILVSISNLSKDIEPISQSDRYKTIQNCISNGLKVLACVSPINSRAKWL